MEVSVLDYSEVFGDIIINDIINNTSYFEFDNVQALFDSAVIRISKKEDYLNITNKNRIVIIYFYSNRLKKLAKNLQQLYEDKINNKDISYEEHNKRIDNVRQEIKKELLINSKKYSVSVKFKNISYPDNFVDKVNIAMDILENGESDKEYKTGNPVIMILIGAFRQAENFIKNNILDINITKTQKALFLFNL